MSINHNNQSDILLGHLNKLLPKLALLKGVVGITLNEGLSRGYADHLSETEITIYLDSDCYRYWHENKASILFGIRRDIIDPHQTNGLP